MVVVVELPRRGRRKKGLQQQVPRKHLIPPLRMNPSGDAREREEPESDESVHALRSN